MRTLPVPLIVLALVGCRQPEPPGPSVFITPEAPVTADDLVATATIDDPEFEELTYTYSWTRDGEATDITSSAVAATETAKGQTWEVTAIATIEDVSSPPVSASVVIGNTAPELLDASLSATEITESDLLVVSFNSTDADNDSLTPTIEWFVNGSSLGAGTNDTLTGDSFAKGDTIYATVTVADDVDSSDPVTTETATVLNTAPTVGGVTIAPSPAYTNDVLTVASNTGDADDDTVTVSYTWFVNGTEAGTGTELDGSTAFGRGDVITVTATPNDGTDDGEAVTSEPITIANALPAATVPTVSPGPAYTNDVLSATVEGSDDDGDTVTIAYSWLVNNVEVGTGPTLDGASAFAKGDVVVLQVTPNDGIEDGTVQASSPLTISNTPPSAPEIEVTPNIPAAGIDDVICSVIVDSTDADGDTVSYSAAWTVNEVAFTGTSTTTFADDTVPGTNTQVDETWSCIVTADDGDAGVAVSDAYDVNVLSCGDSLLDANEEVDPPESGFTNIVVDDTTCRYDFSDVSQLYCNGSCTWGGSGGCDQADADIFCKLITDNPNSVATTFETTTALEEPGFSCPHTSGAYGTEVVVNNRGLDGVHVRYQDTSIRENHGGGIVIVNPVCTDPQ